MKRRFQVFVTAFLLLVVSKPDVVRADLAKDIANLPTARYCVNAGLESAWNATHEILEAMEIETTLEDFDSRLITTAFIHADVDKLKKLARGVLPFSEGRFTLKIELEEVTDAFTILYITLQVRQNKKIAEGEKILNSRGSFEKFIAYRVNKLALKSQFPALYDLRLGFDLVPHIDHELYEVANVEPNSPAGEAGFQNGDMLISIENQPVSIRGEFFNWVLDESLDSPLTFQVERNGNLVDIPLWIVRVSNSDNPIGMQLAWDDYNHEFYIAGVAPESRADQAGLLVDDTILKDGEIPLDSWTNYYRALAADQGKDYLQFEIKRGNDILAVSL